jgi:hypothetical protein
VTGGAGTDHETPRLAAEPRETLLAFLDYLRAAVARKLRGCSDEEARRALVPSGTCLLGLVKHLTVAESYWIQRRFAGLDTAMPADEGFAVGPDDTADSVLRAYDAAIGRNDELIAGAAIDAPLALGRHGLTLTWVLVHLVEETARHAGHADILRELIDGSVGR